ncbi:MAG: aminotransferase class I/II-fold pyridoxal phosphate-dependent enzyme [Lachnospiraceae bacterium]|nr:aminotransferase class I/II-fold pyridoxal phosphate-dependent enzyme [Candidatus Equihabitans merdae]
MKAYSQMTREELLEEKKSLEQAFEQIKAQNLKMDMSRGKPSKTQLSISDDMMDIIDSHSVLSAEDGTDCRNYGVLTGIPEAKKLMADIHEVDPANIIVYGNASLNIMHDLIAHAMAKGICGNTPWARLDNVKFLCPAPGYDRHFKITEFYGIEMITIPMTPEGPDMDMVEEYVNNDASVKGIWCVPKYSNPQGYTYSKETVRRFAALTPAADDFRIFWDNAYTIHHLYDEPERQDSLLEILAECEKAGHPDLVYKFTSTSKVTYPGSGISALATSENNIKDILANMTVQTIGHDKINQLRHARYFGNIANVKKHMSRHAAFLRPKFEAVEQELERSLAGLEIGTWNCPNGGYFISFDALEGCAKAIVAKAAEAGVKMTGAGATFPYGKDPKDSNIRIAPSFPEPDELKKATEVFVLSVKLVSVDKFLGE